MDLTRATDELMAAPWESFVETRARLADDLARAGRRDDSRALKKVRRPSAAAWATNQVVRRSRPAVEAYLAASDDLRERQAAMLEGGGERTAYQAAAEAFRQATAALTQATRQVLQQGAREPDRAQIDGVLANVRAGALAGERRAELLGGRLLADLSAGEGGLEQMFGASLAASAAATAVVTRAPANDQKEEPAAHASHRARESEADLKGEAEARAKREEHARRLAAAVEEETSAREAAQRALAAAEQARAAQNEAKARVDELEEDLVQARQALQEALRGLRAAERDAKERESLAHRATAHRQTIEKQS